MNIISSTFTRYSLTAQEQISGQIYNDSQLAVLHNMRTDIAEQKLNLEFASDNVINFAQQEAFLAGQLKILSHIIDLSAESQKALTAPKSPEV